MSCQVCTSDEYEPHFGGLCCRACAAFFRRYVHSKKMVVKCTCMNRKDNSHPCRKCRIDRCLEIGMQFSKVQYQRGRNLKDIQSTSSLEVDQKATVSRPIALRTYQRLDMTTENWQLIETARQNLYGDMANVNVYEFSCFAKSDTNLAICFVQDYIPEFRQLSSSDKKLFVQNFCTKWVILKSTIGVIKNEHWNYCSGSDITNQSLIYYYGSAMAKQNDIDANMIIQTFDPYWNYYFHRLIQPLRDCNFDHVEFLALFFLLLFDPAYTNISDNCVELCHNMRKVILRELRGYQMNKGFGEMRICDTLEAISMVERADVKLKEEIILCEMNGIQLDDDFKKLAMRNNI